MRNKKVILVGALVATSTALTLFYYQLASPQGGSHANGRPQRRLHSPHPATTEHPFIGEQLAAGETARTISDGSPVASGSSWYVAPNGTPRGDGTMSAAWDLATALAHGPLRKEIKPGDTIWLRGGRYTGTFTSTLTGTANAPIIVRQHPGERAVLDKNAPDDNVEVLKVKGAYTWYWGFEVMNSYPDRNRLDPTREVDPWRGSGVNIYGPHNKFINLTVHDNGHGFGLWNEEGDTEIHGCVLYYNGNNKKEHGIYAHNRDGVQRIVNNIILNGAGYGLHIYANSLKSSLRGFQVEGNAIFSNGALTLDDQVADQVLVGGVSGVPAERITLRGNYIYNPVGAVTGKNRGVRLGYEDTGNKDVRVLGNYIVSKVPLKIQWWKQVEVTGNTIYSQATSVEIKTPAGADVSTYPWDLNRYLSGRKGGPTFDIDGNKYGFADWQRVTGLDGKSQLVQNTSLRPSDVSVFVRQNGYEAGRANVVVYNWDRLPSVAVDVGGALSVGASYEVRDAQNYSGEPVVCGTYEGRPIQLPMNLKQVARPVGNVERIPAHTAPEFAVFIIQQTPKRQCQ